MSLLTGFTSLLTSKINGDSEFCLNSSRLEIFSLHKPLPMKLEYYVDHFLYQLGLPLENLVNGFLLLENFFEKITIYNIHRLVFTALSLSYKFLTDTPVSNSALEKIGGLRQGELAKLEIVLLIESNWRFHYLNYDAAFELLIDNGNAKTTEIENEDESDYDEDYSTGYENNDSFSELSAFFSSESL